MADLEHPFTDLRLTPDGLSLPELKWRELLFVGALRKERGLYVRDPSRPLPPFQIRDVFPDGSRWEPVGCSGGRVLLRRAERL